MRKISEQVLPLAEETGLIDALSQPPRQPLGEDFDPDSEIHWHEERTMPEFPQDLRGGCRVDSVCGAEARRVRFALEPLQFIETPDDRVLTPISQRSRAPEGGVPLETHFFYVWTIREGKVHRVEIYLRRADALEAAGQQE